MACFARGGLLAGLTFFLFLFLGALFDASVKVRFLFVWWWHVLDEIFPDEFFVLADAIGGEVRRRLRFRRGSRFFVVAGCFRISDRLGIFRFLCCIEILGQI